ncbi:maleylacetoacetate isomerase [Pseudochelatococcus sp. B33]
MKLYDNDRSSAAYRVRIALHLKGLDPERNMIVIHGSQAENRTPAYASINPQRLVPALGVEDGSTLTQSLAIIEYIDELHPEPILLPSAPLAKARARAIALTAACDIHPFGTPRVAAYLTDNKDFSEDDVRSWVRHWIREGLDSLEVLIAAHRNGTFAIGDVPTIADIFLVPQALVAERLGLELDTWLNIAEIVRRCRLLPAFRETEPV